MSSCSHYPNWTPSNKIFSSPPPFKLCSFSFGKAQNCIYRKQWVTGRGVTSMHAALKKSSQQKEKRWDLSHEVLPSHHFRYFLFFFNVVVVIVSLYKRVQNRMAGKSLHPLRPLCAGEREHFNWPQRAPLQYWCCFPGACVYAYPAWSKASLEGGLSWRSLCCAELRNWWLAWPRTGLHSFTICIRATEIIQMKSFV